MEQTKEEILAEEAKRQELLKIQQAHDVLLEQVKERDIKIMELTKEHNKTLTDLINLQKGLSGEVFKTPEPKNYSSMSMEEVINEHRKK